MSPSSPFCLLDVPRIRARGSSLPSQISSTELYRLRNFAVRGNKVSPLWLIQDIRFYV